MIKFFIRDDYVDCEQLSEKIENSSINIEQLRENLEAEENNDYKTTEKTITMGDYNVKVITTDKVVEKCHLQDLANDSPVVNAYTGSLEITNSKTGKTYTINLTWDTTLPDDAIEKLLNALQETINIVPEAVAEDIFMENNDFYIFDGKNYADFNAFAGDDGITLAYENMQGETALRPRVLIHETGHNVNFTQDGNPVSNFFQDKKPSDDDIIKYIYLSATYMNDQGQECDPYDALNNVPAFRELGYSSKEEFIRDFRDYSQGREPKNKKLADFIENSDTYIDIYDNNARFALQTYARLSEDEDYNGYRQGIFIRKMEEIYANNNHPKIYALANGMELFAEYYAYKAVGDRKDLINDRGAAYLFDSMKASGDPEQLAFLEYMDNMIEEIYNKPVDDRVGYERMIY